MRVSSLWGKANLSSSYLLDNSKNYRKVTISCESESLTLPVTPWRYEITTAQNNKVIDILDSGEAMLFGNSKLKHLKFSFFFQTKNVMKVINIL